MGGDGTAGTPLTGPGRATGHRGARGEAATTGPGGSPGLPVGRRAARGPGTAATTGRLVPRSGLPAGRRAPAVPAVSSDDGAGWYPAHGPRPGTGPPECEEMGGDDGAGQFPGASGRLPVGRWCGMEAATAQRIPRSRLSAGRRAAGVQGDGQRRMGAAVPRPYLSAARPLAVRGQPQRRDGRYPAPGPGRAAGRGGAEGKRRREGARSSGAAVGRRASGGPGRARGRGRSLPARARGAPPGPRRAPPDQWPPCDLGEYEPSRLGVSGGALIDALWRPLGAIPARPERGSVLRCPYCPCSSARRWGGGGGGGAGRPVVPGLVPVSPPSRLPGVTEGAVIGSGVPVEGVSGTESRSGLAATARLPGPGRRSGGAQGPHPLWIRANGAPGGPCPPESGPEGRVVHREWWYRHAIAHFVAIPPLTMACCRLVRPVCPEREKEGARQGRRRQTPGGRPAAPGTRLTVAALPLSPRRPGTRPTGVSGVPAVPPPLFIAGTAGAPPPGRQAGAVEPAVPSPPISPHSGGPMPGRGP